VPNPPWHKGKLIKRNIFFAARFPDSIKWWRARGSDSIYWRTREKSGVTKIQQRRLLVRLSTNFFIHI